MKEVNKSIIAVILNWNNIVLTQKCIASLKSQKDISIDILLIDNHSDDSIPHNIFEYFPEVEIIILPENKGVAGGRNVGLRYAVKNNYKYILFLDNDAFAHSNMVKELKIVIDRNTKTGIVGPKIYIDNDKYIIWRAGCLAWRSVYLFSWFSIIKKFYRIRRIPIPHSFDIIRGEGQKDIGQFNKEIDVDFQIGCAQMINLELVREIGGFDERFSPYGSEDIDYCERVRRAGWKIKYAPKAICWHKVATQPMPNPLRTYHNLKNIILLARKHLTKKRMLFHFLPDFIIIHLPLIFIDNAIKKIDCAKAVIYAIKWHLKDIKSHGFFLNA
jgi:GT2 family glycosyltransferase